jgi:hypothetical protein
MNRRFVIALVILTLAALLGYAMRESIERNVIQPVLYFWWVLGIYYDSFPQALLWIILIVVIVMIEVGSFTTDAGPVPDGKRDARKPVQGSVESLALWFRRAPDGLYFKWLIAQRLGKLSRELISFNARQSPRSDRDALHGPGWEPPDEVASYLESGLNGSFADYPRPRWPFQRPPRTPLDLDPAAAIDYIESKLEKT